MRLRVETSKVSIRNRKSLNPEKASETTFPVSGRLLGMRLRVKTSFFEATLLSHLHHLFFRVLLGSEVSKSKLWKLSFLLLNNTWNDVECKSQKVSFQIMTFPAIAFSRTHKEAGPEKSHFGKVLFPQRQFWNT